MIVRLIWGMNSPMTTFGSKAIGPSKTNALIELPGIALNAPLLPSFCLKSSVKPLICFFCKKKKVVIFFQLKKKTQWTQLNSENCNLLPSSLMFWRIPRLPWQLHVTFLNPYFFFFSLCFFFACKSKQFKRSHSALTFRCKYEFPKE